MFVLGREWKGGYLDYACGEGETRIAVATWQNLGVVDNAFIKRPFDWRLIHNYLPEIGPRLVLRKILSRTRERVRNMKHVSCGLGRVLDTRGDTFAQSDPVVFLAPFHPRCVDRVVLNDALIRRISPERWQKAESWLRDGTIHYGEFDQELEGTRSWKDWAGWSSDSGIGIEREAIEVFLEGIEDKLLQGPGATRTLEVPPRETSERSQPQPAMPAADSTATPSRRAVVFGLGNYAKTSLIPNIDSGIRVETVHELDPTQLGLIASFPYACDTSPIARADESADVYFIAGYHHTHADLAVHALNQGIHAVVEKPLATDAAQLSRLLKAMETTKASLFACFQKRYLVFNSSIREDLRVARGEPVSCHSLVFEIPLPEKHWYNWPRSRSRLVSNGCHWIDHFLFLNNYSRPIKQALWLAADNSMTALLDLENGASFSMTLTDRGSSRIGIQEHVEFRANGATATITNGSRYFAESSRQVLRKHSINKLSVYKEMYREITRRISKGGVGDSVKSVQVSTQTMLDLEDELTRICAART
ncbi:Predicted dehydrogenase [Singulisphaera sp. GP187]|uniref:Gfo/Idh/MocA family protein n=1 Tax=Singulisphaera sp. GP187 TaxID=1882752 RepID=UPI0009268F58|nr:Gfo/Idh/MocA family oxidoreductase [Singulisphaera sp. GP187]SIO55249.1 Predicted dehydrogenase [Singulisphaera sp. GP187]